MRRFELFLPWLAGLAVVVGFVTANRVEGRPQEESEYRGLSYRPVRGFPWVFMRHHYHRDDAGSWLTYGIIRDPDESRPKWELWLFGPLWRVYWGSLVGNALVALGAAGLAVATCEAVRRRQADHSATPAGVLDT